MATTPNHSRSQGAFPTLDALLAAYQERLALVGTTCRCGGTYEAEDQKHVWDYTVYLCELCGEEADEQYAVGAYAGRYCETPGCSGSWERAPFRGKDVYRVDWLDAGEYDDADAA